MLTVLVAPDGERYKVVPTKNGDRLFVAYLEVSETSKGPRPTKFRVVRDDDQELREPSEFVDLCRMADEVVVPRSSSDDDKREVEEMLSAYQIEAVGREVCRLCLVNDRYTSLSDRNAVKHHDERICQDCAKEELGREISYKGDLSSTYRS
ncbi:MAG: hypothetical protein SV760_00080 [Halobacteria archaeon]|nr:hypothetical protein [Halobacteria archaeon]